MGILTGLGSKVAGLFSGRYVLYLAIAVAVTTSGLYLYQRSEIAQIESALVLKEKQVAELSAELRTQEIIKNLTVQTNEILSQTITEERKRTEELSNILEEISNAPETDDGPIAPVLQRTLDRLFPDK